MIKPNLPEALIKKAIVSSEVSKEILDNLFEYGIQPVMLLGYMNCDISVRHHPDLYVCHISEDLILSVRNICSLKGEKPCKIRGINIEVDNMKLIEYPYDVFFNSVIIGKDLICCKKYTHKDVIKACEEIGYRIINVNQGYTKCNICVVDENSIITEDRGIYNTLCNYDYNVLLLETHCVKLPGYKYGFIGGASGKISRDKLAFFGNIKEHAEYNRIYEFLAQRGITAVSLSNEQLTDYGSLIPLE